MDDTQLNDAEQVKAAAPHLVTKTHIAKRFHVLYRWNFFAHSQIQVKFHGGRWNSFALNFPVLLSDGTFLPFISQVIRLTSSRNLLAMKDHV